MRLNGQKCQISAENGGFSAGAAVPTAKTAENWHFQAILDAFLMIMIQFFKILRIECAYTENWKNDGGPAAAAENRRPPPKFCFAISRLIRHLWIILKESNENLREFFEKK